MTSCGLCALDLVRIGAEVRGGLRRCKPRLGFQEDLPQRRRRHGDPKSLRQCHYGDRLGWNASSLSSVVVSCQLTCYLGTAPRSNSLDQHLGAGHLFGCALGELFPGKARIEAPADCFNMRLQGRGYTAFSPLRKVVLEPQALRRPTWS